MRPGRAGGLVVLMAAWALFASPANAQVERAYTATGVAVDQTAQSAALAREQAIASGQRLALRKVLERVTPRAESRRLPQVSAARLTDLVASFEVEDERVSATRYLGRLTVRFKPEDVRNLLRNAGIPVAETFARPVVVLPVLKTTPAPILWEDTNAWRAAWSALPKIDGLVPMIVPLGDLEDAAAISVDAALNGNADAAARIARRYDATGVLVAVVTPGRPNQPIRIDLTRVGVEGSVLPGFESFARRAREDDATYFGRAATAAVEQVEENWKSDVMIQFGREGRLVAVAPIRGLQQWVALRTQLGTVPAVRKSDLVSLTQSEAVVEITFVGDETQLRLALAQRNLQLADDGGRWRLESTGAP
jgi:hypothetical protein